MAFRMTPQQATRHPGLRDALQAAQSRKPPSRRSGAMAGACAGASLYDEWDAAREIGGARHWVLDLPDMELANANDRPHWTRRQRLTGEIRGAAMVLARKERVPFLSRARVVYVVKPKLRTRVFDPSNWAPSAKAAVDGLQDARVFNDDNASVVTGVDPRAGERQSGMNVRISLVIIDQGKQEGGAE